MVPGVGPGDETLTLDPDPRLKAFEVIEASGVHSLEDKKGLR